MHTYRRPHHRAPLWLCAILGSIALSLAIVSSAGAEEEGGKEGNANGLNCLGHISVGAPELGSEEQQVRYTFYCNGPITGYQLETNVPVSGFEPTPLVTNNKSEAISDTFSCGGELPGWADNCVGATKLGWETVTGQFSISAPLCAEPRADPLLSVTSIYLEKGVPTQAISGPFDLGRPLHCPASRGYAGGTRLHPATPRQSAKVNAHKRARGKTRHGTSKRK